MNQADKQTDKQTEKPSTHGEAERPALGAVIVAAGQGSRMGDLPKCLIQLDGQSLISRLQRALTSMDVARVVVVTGFYATAIEAELNTLPVSIARNMHPEAGQRSSVALGLQTLGGDFDLVLVALADQPQVGSEEFSELISAFRHRPAGTSVVVPFVDGQRGNPVVFSGALIRHVLAENLHGDLRGYIDSHPECVHKMNTGNPNFTLDLDTPEDVQNFAHTSGFSVELPASTVMTR